MTFSFHGQSNQDSFVNYAMVNTWNPWYPKGQMAEKLNTSKTLDFQEKDHKDQTLSSVKSNRIMTNDIPNIKN